MVFAPFVCGLNELPEQMRFYTNSAGAGMQRDGLADFEKSKNILQILLTNDKYLAIIDKSIFQK